MLERKRPLRVVLAMLALLGGAAAADAMPERGGRHELGRKRRAPGPSSCRR